MKSRNRQLIVAAMLSVDHIQHDTGDDKQEAEQREGIAVGPVGQNAYKQQNGS